MLQLNKITAFIICILIIVIATIYYSIKIANVSLNKDLQSYNTSLVHDSVKAYKNLNGFIHIISSNDEDAFFMLGYCHSQDRLFQMDILRRTATGRLSEVLGSKTVESDKLMRALKISKTAKENWKSVNKETKKMINAYVAGINFYIKEHKKNLSFEFGTLDYLPEEWKPTDCLAISRLISFEMCYSFWLDIPLGKIAEKLGANNAMELMPHYSNNNCFVLDSKLSNKDTINKIPKNNNLSALYKNKELKKELDNTFASLLEIKNTLGIENNGSGSNSWAVRKGKNRNGAAILANDPHLSLQLPSIWYPTHITCNAFNLIGASIPGEPFCLLGRNDYISWGITNTMIDDFDFFIEKIDPQNNNYYFSDSLNKKKFTYEQDTILVKNKMPIIYYVRQTNRSSVISDVKKDIILDSASITKGTAKYCLTYSWTGNCKSDEFASLYRLIKSKNWNDFNFSLKTWGSPAITFTYADKEGNIGLHPTGFYPNRESKNIHFLPNPSWLKDYAWNGYKELSSVGYLYNPEKQFVAAANNKLLRDSSQKIAGIWSLQSRAQRINELLSQHLDYNAREAQLMQCDILSYMSKEVVNKILPILRQYSMVLDQTERNGINFLTNWDYICSPYYSSPTIYNVFFEKLMENIFSDELGEALFKEYSYSSSIIMQKTLELLDQPNSYWFNDKRTNKIESRNDIVINTYKETIEYLKGYFKTDDINQWKYSKIHTLTLTHIFSDNKFLNPTVTSNKFEVGGSNSTINATYWNIGENYETKVGASIRFIADMGDSLVYMSLPGGVSGDPVSPNYADQVHLWLNGGYLKISNSRYPAEKYKLAVVMSPK